MKTRAILQLARARSACTFSIPTLLMILIMSAIWIPAPWAADPALLTTQIDVDLDEERRSISPLIYGVSLADADQLASVPYPINRWGGNSKTRYNWRADVSNRASDWFFMNIPEPSLDPAQLPDGSTADLFVAESLAAGAEPLITVPLIGWTPISVREKRWGFSVTKYGPQDATECTVSGWPSWCKPDAGNGLSSGIKLTGNDPTDTSMTIDETWITDWISHLGPDVSWLSLDNEPMLWSETHFDVHPDPVDYDEIWARTATVAGAIKAAHPDTVLLGPVVWGWCAYLHSAADGCSPGPDQAAHNGQPFLEWYLDQICLHQSTTGVRLVDVLDVHYYPQGGQALTGEGDPALQALRLRSVKDLYDPAYVSESWINQPVHLIPRLSGLIEQRCPGLGLAITEYNWGSDGISSALAQAEVLAVLGREGALAAMRWVAPDIGSKVEEAFKLFLDYDGSGSAVLGHSVQCISSDVDRVGAYAVESTTGDLLLLLFNKDTSDQPATVVIQQPISGTAPVYRFTASQSLGPAGTVDVSAGTLSTSLPARSATLIRIIGATDLLFTDGFESGGTSSWSTGSS